ncbi:LacI family DNA-binding transcriptional regulator [Oceaniglobus trochenteri]|uniref:LacI family DNA-binding transcriptional regulator n=1 Tax=Oceaniglobus trochenteri TaxID=2763260 RepID=UPI001D000F03|nr:LacI family DNA-binding transcriptional regulator [Oceaniglobus trochenteri]
MNHGRKATLSEIARLAGVSKATVDRVMNNRGSVQPQTRLIVMQAASRAGHPGATDPLPEVASAVAPPVTVLLPQLNAGYLSTLTRKLQDSHAAGTLAPDIVTVPRVSPENYAAAIDRAETPYLAIIAVDHPLVRQSCAAYARRGGKLVTLLSRISDIPCLAHVGVDNRAEGRLAAWFAQVFRGSGTGEIAFLHGLSTFQSQEQRELGFRSAIQESGNLSITAAFETANTTSEAVIDAVTNLLAGHPNLTILYNMSIRNREVAEAVARSGRKVVLIGHDLTDTTKQLLLEGRMAVVLDQNIGMLIDQLGTGIARDHAGLAWPTERIEPRFFCRENLPI